MRENSGDKESHLKNRENNNVRRQLWISFSPTVWLSSKWKKSSIRSRLHGLRIFLSKNIVPVSVSVAVGLCYLLPKLETWGSKVVPYSELVRNLKRGIVTRVQFVEDSRLIFYNTKLPRVTCNIQVMLANVLRKLTFNLVSLPTWQYSTRNIVNDKSNVLELIREKGVKYGAAPQYEFIKARRILMTVLREVIRLCFYFYFHRQLFIGKSVARKASTKQMVTFDDVEGVDAAKIELMEIVSCLHGDINYENLGAKLPRGVLLVGPPGTGKTLLARAVAGKAGVPFFVNSASEFVEVFVGRGAARVRDLFSEARKCAPSVIFIDELDAVGARRSTGFSREFDQTLNQLLTEMDGFVRDEKVVVIAATNRSEMLDPALCRPGRFSRKVFVGEPDEDGRSKILGVHMRRVPFEEDKDLICNLVASLTPGLVGADLANIVNEAALLAARRGGQCVSREDLMEAIKREINQSQRRPSQEGPKQGSQKTVPTNVMSQVERWHPGTRQNESKSPRAIKGIGKAFDFFRGEIDNK